MSDSSSSVPTSPTRTSSMTKSVASLIAQQQRELHQAEKQQQQQQQQHNEKPPRAVASYSRRPRGDSGSSAAGGGANDDVDDESLGSVAATRVPSSRYRTSRGGSFHRFGSGVGMATTDGDDEESSASTTSAAETALSTFGPVVKLNVGGTIYQTRLALLRTGVAKGTFFGAMFSGRHNVLAEEDGSFFIDRDGPSFRYVINFLREPTRAFSFVGSRYERELALRDAEYYALPAAYIDQLKYVDFGMYAGDGYAFLDAGKYVYCDGDARKLHPGALRRFGKHARNLEIQLFAVAIRSSCVTKVSCDQHTLGQAANLDGAIQLWFADDKIASFGDVGVSESLISVVPLETPTEWLVNCMGEHGLHVRVTTWCGCRATAKIIELYGRVRVPYDVANNFA